MICTYVTHNMSLIISAVEGWRRPADAVWVNFNNNAAKGFPPFERQLITL